MWHSIAITFGVVFTVNVALVLTSSGCDKPHFEKCFCGVTNYLDVPQYVLNCTNKGFNNISMLGFLPEETEVLIFIGNTFDDLPWNVFGNNNSNSKLKVVDLSNNKIKAIRGKTFHHVRNVERLILNHNDINIAASRDHPRIFSNFENLLELHLTNAFDDNPVDNYEFASDLQAILVNSNLTKLKKLHLEQNEISGFEDAPAVFCDLKSLMDLHLADNHLTHVNFKFDCLHNLRYIDFEGNWITRLSDNDFHLLDALPKRGQSLIIELNDNPLSCDYFSSLTNWMQTTNVTVRHQDKLKCNRNKTNLCSALTKAQPDVSSSSGTIVLLSVALCVSIALLIYTNREPIRNSVYPALLSLSRNIHYTNIGRQDAQEMDV